MCIRDRFSPFLYSKVQSSNKILGFSIFLDILPGKHTSLFIMTPFNTVESSSAPPGIFSTFANFLISISVVLPSGPTVFTVCTASNAKFGTKSPNLAVNFVPTVDLTVHFRQALVDRKDDYVLAVFRTRYAHEGFLEEDGEIWSRDGELLAQSRQLAVVL